MRVEIRKRGNVRYVIMNTIFLGMMVKYAIYFGVNIQKNVSAPEKRSAFKSLPKV
jgi:hypothetical protein